MFARMGAQSVLAVGGGNAMDTAKAVRHRLEGGLTNTCVEEVGEGFYRRSEDGNHLQFVAAVTQPEKKDNSRNVPLICVSTTASTVSMQPTFAILQGSEENALMKHRCRNAEVLFIDTPLVVYIRLMPRSEF